MSGVLLLASGRYVATCLGWNVGIIIGTDSIVSL